MLMSDVCCVLCVVSWIGICYELFDSEGTCIVLGSFLDIMGIVVHHTCMSVASEFGRISDQLASKSYRNYVEEIEAK